MANWKSSMQWLTLASMCFASTGCLFFNRSKKSQSKPEGTQEPLVLRFTRQEGPIENHFFRDATVASHVLLTSGIHPRLIFAFPSGNEGAALIFNETKVVTEAKILSGTKLDPIKQDEGFVGVSGDFVFRAQTLSLKLNKTILGSVRAMRDYAEGNGLLHQEMMKNFEMKPTNNGVHFIRKLFDGKHEIRMSLETLDGSTQITTTADGIQLQAAKGEIKIRVRVLTNETQLTPISAKDIFNEKALNSEKEKLALEFLTYQEKLLAGSWRFMTYFGRDTLMSIRLLMPVLRPAVIEAALGSVLSRVYKQGVHLALSKQIPMKGQVAHEEDIGDWAAFHHQKEGATTVTNKAVHDYRMVDADFMLAPVLTEYLLNSGINAEDQQKFLAIKTKQDQETEEETYASAALRNLDLVMSRAKPFAMAGTDSERKSALISLLPGEIVGDWRDSSVGLGMGLKPYSLNASLVPAALRAAAQLYLLPAFGSNSEAAALAEKYASTWESRAAKFFRVSIPQKIATKTVAASCKRYGIAPCIASQEIANAGEQVFEALALDKKGAPIPVMHSDDGFLLLFNAPDLVTLQRIASRITMTYPAGLKTDAGAVVANAVYANAAIQDMFSQRDYHGAVIWSWQQALLAAGLERQIKILSDQSAESAESGKDEVREKTLEALKLAQSELWKVIQANAEARSFELWGWKHEGGKFVPVSFSTLTKDGTESNALQLWSTVFLAVQPPKP